MTPAFIISNQGFEFFAEAGHYYIISNGTRKDVLSVSDLPDKVYNDLKREISHDDILKRGLEIKVGKDFDKQIFQLCKCRFSDYDSFPDFQENNKPIAEFSNNCPEALNCPQQAKSCICKRNPYDLTLEEIEIMRLVADDFSTKQIASIRFKAERTVTVQIQSILKKINAQSRAGIVRFAVEHDLVITNEQKESYRRSLSSIHNSSKSESLQGRLSFAQ